LPEDLLIKKWNNAFLRKTKKDKSYKRRTTLQNAAIAQGLAQKGG